MNIVKNLFLAILMGAAVNVSAQPNRGAANVKIKTDSGQTQEIKLYDGSYALVIGMSAYTNGWDKLEGVKTDVSEVSRVLQTNGFKVEAEANLSADALKARIEKFISDYGFSPNNRLLIYFAGHGHTMKASDGRDLGYIIPIDTPLPEKDELGFRRKAISMDTVQNYARMIESKHALFIFDSCFSGKLISRSNSVVPPVIKEDVTYPVRQFITAGAANQPVPDDSIFRKAFVRGLEGEADVNGDGYITGSELASYLKEKVTNASERMQTPQYGKIRDIDLERGDFVFSLNKETAVSGVRKEVEKEFWDSIKDSQDADYFRLYKEKYPNGVYVPLADLKIKQLSSSAASKPEINSNANRIKSQDLAQKAFKEVIAANFETADELAQKALELNNENADALGISGWMKSVLFGDYEAARIELEKSLRITPANPVFLTRLALVQEGLGNKELSAKTANQAIALLNAPKTDVEFYTAALAKDILNNTNAAISNLNEAVKINPRSALFFNARGVSLQGLIDYKVYNPSKPTTREEILASENYNKAFADFDTAIRLNPAFFSAYFNRAQLAYNGYDFDGAINNYSKFIEIRPKDVKGYVYRAKVYKSNAKTLNLALADYDRAIQIDEFNASLYFSRAEVLDRLKRYDEVVRDYTKVIEIRPSDSAGYNNRGNAFYALGQYESALRDYTKSIEINSKDSSTFRNRANVYRKMGKSDAALRDYAKAIELNADDTHAYFQRAELYAELGNAAAADADRRKVSEINQRLSKPK